MPDSIADTGVEEEIDAQEQTVEEPETLLEPGTDEAEEAEAQDTAEGEEKGESEEEPEEYEEIEFDFGGKKFAVGKDKTVDAVAGDLQEYAKSLEGDYTQKTQAVAEQRKSLEAQTEAIKELSSLNDEAFELHSQAKVIKDRLAQYQNVQWEQLRAEDPEEYGRYVADQNFLQMEHQRVQQELQGKTNALKQTQSQQRDRFLTEGKKQVQAKIKGFDDAKARELVDYVVEKHGIPREKAEDWALNPAGTIMAYKAMEYDKMQDNLKTAKKPKVKSAVPVPATKTSTRSKAKTYAEMTMEEYAKARNKEEGIG